ncbi:MAG: hypothetical protein J2P36_11220 [Ktedonobacteraceae bacterium]|nr:hypothetical protein [Ktedonobacteraceae bacterium]
MFQQAEIYRLGPFARVFKPTSIWVTLTITVGIIILDIVLSTRMRCEMAPQAD